MRKITLLVLSVGPADPSGYELTASLYCEYDRQPSQMDTYGPLSHEEVETLVAELVFHRRPGWQYEPGWSQPDLFNS